MIGVCFGDGRMEPLSDQMEIVWGKILRVLPQSCPRGFSELPMMREV